MANGLFGGGDGSPDKPFLVEDAADLDMVRRNLRASYLQTNHISLKDYDNWLPISSAYEGESSEYAGFMGVYDFNNKNIRDMVCTNQKNSSLFGLLGGDIKIEEGVWESVAGVLKNGNVIGAVVINQDDEGYGSILCTFMNKGLISNCTVNGIVKAGYACGMVTGLSEECVVEKSSCNDVEVYGRFAGGFSLWGVGSAESSYIKDCYTTGIIGDYQEVIYYEDDWAWLGGFCYSGGYQAQNIENCYSAMTFICDRHYGDSLWSSSGIYPFSQYQKNSCYVDMDEMGAVNDWALGLGYFGDNGDGFRFARGADGISYTCINNQQNIDYSYWEPEWNETGPPPGWPPQFFRAEPGVGAIWQDYWIPTLESNDETIRSTAQMMSKENYVGWDFENVWDIKEGESYPFFKKVIPVVKCKAIPMGRI